MTQFRPGGFQILPMVVQNLLIINILVYLAQYTLKLPFIENTFALHTWQSPLFKPWQFVTYMFLHGGWWHLIGNMFYLWICAPSLETSWGPWRFLVFYIACGLGGALAHMTTLYFENENIMREFYAMDTGLQAQYQQGLINHLNVPTLGASGAIYGCIVGFGYLFSDDIIYFNFIPIKIKWFALISVGGELYLEFQNSAGGGIAHMAHLGGALVGFLMVYFWKKNNRRGIY